MLFRITRVFLCMPLGKQMLLIKGLIWYGNMRYDVLVLRFESRDQFEIPE